MISEEIRELAMRHYGREGVLLEMIEDLVNAWEEYKYYNDCDWDEVEKRINRLKEMLREL